MPLETEFCLLGPLQVRVAGVPRPVPRGKQRAVLAALLLSAGRTVSLDELIEALWGDNPPASARVTVQNHVMRLRKTLGTDAGARIVTQTGGYLITLAPGELDAARFEASLAAARAAARGRAWDAAAARAREALALWRGDPLADVDSGTLTAREVPWLTELRLQALETRVDADLHLGRHAELIAELRRLAAAHPLREGLCAQLMLALYRDGRQAEALAAYRRARAVLVSEYGIDPGARLRDMHQQVLTASPALALTVPAPRRAPQAGHGPASRPSGRTRGAIPRS